MRVSWRKLAASGLVCALATLVGVPATFSAFSGTTADPGNSFAAGTVTLADNDSGSAMLAMAGMQPGSSDTSCVTVTSTGTLPSLVRLYGTTGGTGLDAFLNVVVTRGTGAAGFDDCTGFTPDATDWIGSGAGVVYAGTLAAFPDAWAAGVQDPRPSVPEAWTTGESHSYRFAVTLADDNGAQTLTATQAFTWEARNTTLYSQVVMSDNPASYWKLDEAAGTTAADSAGPNPGTYTNSPVLNQSSGVKDAATAVAFDGVNDRVQLGDIYDFAGRTPFSFELWLNRSAPGPSDPLSKGYWTGGAGGYDGWTFRIYDAGGAYANRLGFERYDGSSAGAEGAIGTTVTQAGVWYHVAGTYDGTTTRLYVNGVLEGTVATNYAIADHAQPMRIGHYTHNWWAYGGLLDEVAIYAYPLTAQQVTQHYQAGRR